MLSRRSRDRAHHSSSEIEDAFGDSKLGNMVISRDGCTVDHPKGEWPLDRGGTFAASNR
jgi:hypothetical protein